MNVGRILAYLGDDEQAEVINEMGRGLYLACKGENKEEFQVCAIVEKLDGNGKHLVQALAEFVALCDEADKRGRR